MKIIERYDKIMRYTSALSYLFVSLYFISLWVFPSQGKIDSIITCVGLILFEFVLAHSGLFMIAFSGLRIAFVLFVAFYGLFAYVLNHAMPGNTVLYTYMFIVLSRMRFIFYEKDKALTGKMLQFSALSLGIYFVLIFLTLAIRNIIPHLGLTEGFLIKNNYSSRIQGSGLFIDSPHVALAFGAAYFMLLSIVEFKMSQRKAEQAQDS